MGVNSSGQLGDGTFNNTNKPEQVVANGVVAVTAGSAHSLFLKSDGSLWAMGTNSSGQLGDGTTSSTNRPEQIVANGVVALAAGYAHSLFAKSDGSLWGMGNNGSGQLGNGSSGSLFPEQLTGSAGGAWVQGTCLSGGTYTLLSGTNLARPVGFWVPVWTNSIVLRGSNNFFAPLPNALNSGIRQQFYILQSQ